MNRLLIKQGVGLPFLYFATVLIGGLLAADYSHLGQHVSELAINERMGAKWAFNIGISLTGISMIFLGFGMILGFRRRFLVSGLLTVMMGVTFLFGVVFPIGSPWHGAYGIGFAVVVLPVTFLFELGRKDASNVLKYTVAASKFVLIVYFWLILAQLYPLELRGLAQRIFGIALFGYLSLSALALGSLQFNYEA